MSTAAAEREQHSEAVEPSQDTEIRGVVGWLSWVSPKSTNEQTKDAIKAAGLKVPAWSLTTAGLRDFYQRLRGHLLFPSTLIYTINDEATGGAVPGQGITKSQYDEIPDGEKKDSGYRQRRFALVGVVDEKLNTITPAVFEMGSAGLYFTISRAEENFNRSGLDERISFPGFRTIFTGDATLGKNEKTNRPQINGNCLIERVRSDDANGVRCLKHIADPQFKASVQACRKAMDAKINRILFGETKQED